MSLFHDADREDESAQAPRPSRVRAAGLVLLIAALLIGLVLAFVPSPYGIEVPGPAFNTLGVDRAIGRPASTGSDDPLITIPGRTTYPTSGSLDLLTVSVVGTPAQRPDWLQVVRAWFDPSQAVVPITELYPAGLTEKQQEQQTTQQMVDSQQDAIAAALNDLDYDITQRVQVAQVVAGEPAVGILDRGDRIVSLDGMPITSVGQLRSAVAANGTAKAATLGILRDGTASTVEITPVKQDGATILGIGVGMDYRFPFQVTIQLDDVGGPSAGMMFALGIIDKLTPGRLNGGARVAGTGTIDNTGTVGAIGGIRQKLYGARAAGARYFLAPKANCDEVVGHVPSGLRVFSVSTLDDSLAVLKALRAGSGLGDLPTCTSG